MGIILTLRIWRIFSDEEEEPWEEVGPSEDVQPNVRTDCVGNDTSNSCERSGLPTKPTEVTHHVMELHGEDYWANFRLLAKQAFKLDNVKLAASDYPVAVKELVVRSRVTFQDIHDRADRWFEELQELDDAGDSVLSDYFCSHKDRLEDYAIPVRDWHYNKSPIMDDRATDAAYKSVENADNAEGHDLTLEMEMEDKLDVCSEPDARAKFELSPTMEDRVDVCSEPDARAKFELSPTLEDGVDVCSEPDTRARFELSPTKHVVALDKIRVNCITDGDVTVIRGNVAGDSDAHEDECIRVSMISVDETRRGASAHIHNSLGIRDCVIPECETQPTLVAYRDSALCNKESLPIMTKYCFGLCGSTNQFHSTDFEWCVECVNRLIWGFLVSCVVSIVTKNRSVGTDVFIKGSDVFVSIWGLLDGLIAPCDAMHECWWSTEDFKDTLNNVMLGRGAKMISHDVPGGEDNGQVLPITKEVQSQEEGCDNQPNMRRLEEGDGTALMTGGGPDTGPGTMLGPRRGEALSVPAPQLHQPPPPSEVPDWSDGEAMPLIIIENSSVPPTPTKTIDGLLVDSDDVLRLYPAMNSSGDPGILSAPLSPNRVRKGHSQDMPAEGSLFDVSPDIPGFHMRPAGASVQQADITKPPPPNYVGFNNPFFGTPIAFAQCQNTAGMDTTTTLPVYSIPRNCSVGMDQSALPTVYASGVSPDSIPWSTAEDIIRDIAREGPFDTATTPMDTKDSPLINASMPGCPFRMTSYTGPATVDADTSYGLQLHHPRFLEFIGAPESARLLNQSPSFWVDRLGQDSAMAAAVNLQRDAGFMMTNIQILGQFVMSLHRMSAEMLCRSCSVSGG